MIAAFFDIDGTLYRDSLLIEHFKKLIKYELIDPIKWYGHLEDTYTNWNTRNGRYDDYLHELSDRYVEAIKGMTLLDLNFTADQVIRLKADRVYKYTRAMIKRHKEMGHKVIFISGSPDFLVMRMARKYGVDDWRASKYCISDDIVTGDLVPMWDSDSKNIAIDEFVEKFNIDLSQSYAYGDTNGDFTMLKRVGKPIAINPSNELLRRISEDEELSKRAKIVIERKDVIYNVSPNVDLISVDI